MKINYKYSRNNAQFLYDLSCTSNVDQLIRRLTGHQIITNDNNEEEHVDPALNGEKEYVDPAFNVDEILINGVEVFNRAEHETVYNNIDKLCAPWDGTENKELSEEDAKRRNADLTKAASLLKAYNNRFVELDKYLSLLPAEVRNIPNEFMSIGVNGFYRTVSISLGLDKYLDEISTDEKAAMIFNTAEEQSQALTNVMNVINFLSKLDESAKELFDSDSTKVTPVDEGQLEAPTGDTEEASTGDQHESDKGQLEATGDQHESDDSHEDTPTGGTEDTPTGGTEDTPTGGTEEAPTGDQHEDTPTGSTEEVPTGDQHEDTPNGNTKDEPTGDQHEGHEDTSNGNAKESSTVNEGQQDALDGVAAIDAQLFPSLDEFLGSND